MFPEFETMLEVKLQQRPQENVMLLFPEFETMVEVKAAAEAARERYAAHKARRLEHDSSSF